MEVRVLCNLICRDGQSTTCQNLRYISVQSNEDPWTAGQELVKQGLISTERVPVNHLDQWRIPYLTKLLDSQQQAKYVADEQKMDNLNQLIHSLVRG